MNKSKVIYPIVLGIFLGLSASHAQTLASYDIPVSSTGTVSQATVSPSSGPAGVIASVISTGAGLSGDRISTGWGSTSWGFLNSTTSQNISTFSAALANGDYFEWSLTAPGYDLSITGFGTLNLYRSSAGPTNFGLYYSFDNFATAPIALGTISSISTTAATPTPGTGLFNASPITVRSGQTITFRLAGYGATSNGGSGRIKGDSGTSDFTILGTTTVVNLPKSVVWNGVPGDTWSTNPANLFWLDNLNQSVSFNNGDTPSFNAGASVLVDPAGVTVPSMTNNSSAGQIQTFNQGAINCLGILTKLSGGTLSFSNTVGVNNAINAVNLSGGTLVLQGGGTNRIGTPSLLMAAGSTFDLGDTDQNVTDFNGLGTVVMTNMAPSAANPTRSVPINDFKATPLTPSTFSGQITGTGTFRLGGGTLTLEGNNTYTGQTVMNGTGAILYIWGQSNIPAQTAFDPLLDGLPNGEQYATDLRFANTSTLAIMEYPGFPNQVVLNRSIGVTNPSVTPTFWGGSSASSSLELAGPIKTLGSINISNASASSYGTVILSGNNPSLTGIKISAYGKLKFSGQTNFGGATMTISGGDATPYLALANGSLSNVTVTNLMSIASSNRLNVSVGTYTVTGPIGDGSDNVTNNKVLKWNGTISGTGALLVTNSGTLVFGAANSYSGGTQLRGAATLLVSAQNQLPLWTVGSTTSQDADLRFSTGKGTFGLDDSAGPTNLVLTNSFYATAEGTFMAGTQTNGSSLTLAGPISGDADIVASNSVTNAGTLILKGTNRFTGRLQVAARARVYVVEQANIANQIYLSDTTGYGRFGLDASASNSVTLSNAVLVGLTSSSTLGTFSPGTNSTTGVNRALHLQGVISGPGRVRVADGGDLCLDNSANTYTNLTRVGTGRILFGSDGALGGPSTPDGLYGGIRFETISSSYLVATNSVALNASRTILIQNNTTANLDSQGYTLTVPGTVQDEVAGQPGSVNKLGLGDVVLSGSLAYSGNTTVSAGKLTLNQINAANNASTITITTGAVLNLDFSGNQTVDKLYLNGVQSAAGTYNSANSGGAITGTGSLLVTSSPVITNTAPVITAAQGFSVAESVSLATVVGTVVATDADANSSLSGWAIVSGNTGGAFAINVATGQITVAGALNYEGTPSYSLGITVSDGTATSAVGTVVVTVTNVAEYSDPDLFGISSPTADDNGDGISNLMAYALGATNPSSVVVPPALNTEDPTKLTIRAMIRINDPQVTVVGEYGTTLGTWATDYPIAGVPSSSQAGVVPGVTQWQDFSIPRDTDRKFMHLKATQTQ